MAVGTWVDGSSSWRSEKAASTPKTTMATVTMPMINRLARLSLVSDVMNVPPRAHRAAVPKPSRDGKSSGKDPQSTLRLHPGPGVGEGSAGVVAGRPLGLLEPFPVGGGRLR